MLESKWVLFTVLLFGFGQLLATEMSDITGTSAESIERIPVLTSEQLKDLAPSDEEVSLLETVGAAFRGIGVVLNMLKDLLGALAWNYPFLADGVGGIFKSLILWPLSVMMSLMIVGYIRNLIRL